MSKVGISHIAYKYRIYPNKEQKIKFVKTFGCCRKVYNLMLGEKIEHYKKTGKNIVVTPARYKKEYTYLKEVDSLALANEQLNLQKAYTNFFARKSVGFPKFKSKKTDYNSYTTNNVNNNMAVNKKTIRLPKIGEVKAKVHREVPQDTGYKLKSMTVSQKADGTYYVSVLYEYENKVEKVEVTKITKHIGLDYKSDGLYIDSKGYCPKIEKYYRKSQKQLAKRQKTLSKKEKGSKNYQKAKIKVAKYAQHIANQRKDYLHKKSAEITNQYELISVEDMDMKSVARRKSKKKLKLGKATMDNGYGLFREMLEYKQKKKGHYFIKVDKYYPSSQLCQCGYVNPDAKDLKVRIIECPVCKRIYDRDENAAKNIDKEGYHMLIALEK